MDPVPPVGEEGEETGGGKWRGVGGGKGGGYGREGKKVVIQS